VPETTGGLYELAGVGLLLFLEEQAANMQTKTLPTHITFRM